MAVLNETVKPITEIHPLYSTTGIHMKTVLNANEAVFFQMSLELFKFNIFIRLVIFKICAIFFIGAFVSKPARR